MRPVRVMRDMKYLYVGPDVDYAITIFKGQLRDYTTFTGQTNPLTLETSCHATNDAKDSVLSIYGVPHDHLRARLQPN